MKIGIIGYGKMGKSIEALAVERDHDIAMIIDQDNKQELANLSGKEIDVVIEFSTPETAFNNISAALEAGVPVVSGTTGWLDRYDEIVALCRKVDGTFLTATNFSLGVNLFFKLNRFLASMMNAHAEYAPRMTEEHHTQKLDKPSGTAITLAEGLTAEMQRITDWQIGARHDTTTLPIESIRRDEVPGTHTINYTSETDEIEIKHLAKSRKGFTLGAVLVAEWIADKKGVFTMEDFLKI